MTRPILARNGDRTSLVFDPKQLLIANLGAGNEVNIQVHEEGTTITFAASHKPLVVQNDRLYRRLS